jgi:hypothetical protein
MAASHLTDEPVMIAYDDPKLMRRRYHLSVPVDFYYYASMTRDDFEKYISDQIEIAASTALELIMRDYDNPKSS